ncbi:MAG: preprotein translocase subunit SecG [Acidobacteria bacterium]|nr:preprotein translocase subunit SecG [Acidobacteriota bacterium]
MIYLFATLHVIVCLFLIIVVLLQSGKAADLAGAFGGMGSQTAFGPRGAASVLSRATTVAAVLFMVTSLTLSILYTRMGSSTVGSSVLEKAPASTSQPAKSSPQGPVGQPEPGKPIRMEVQTPDGKTVGTQEIPLPDPKAPAATPKQAPAAPKK